MASQKIGFRKYIKAYAAAGYLWAKYPARFPGSRGSSQAWLRWLNLRGK